MHSCEKTSLCSICFNYYDNKNEHYCPLEKQKKPDATPRPMAAYDLETQVQENSSNCNNCLIQEQIYLTRTQKLRSELTAHEMKNIYCSTHQEKTDRESAHECNLIATVFENQYFGSFDLIVMADPALQYSEDFKLQKNYFKPPKENYYDPLLFGRPISRKVKKPQKFRSRLTSSKNTFPIKMYKNHSFEIGSDKPLTEDDLSFLKTLPPMEKFVAYFINPRFSNQVFLVNNSIIIHFKQIFIFFSCPQAHYGGSFDVHFLINCLLKFGITPDILCRGHKVLVLHIREFAISFMDSFKYVKTSLARAAKTFGLPIEKGKGFPVRFNSRKNYNVQTIPPFPWFVNENDSEMAVKEKKEFWLKRKQEPWIFCEELILYCVADSFILAQICVRFCKEWVESQLKMQEFFNKKNKKVKKVNKHDDWEEDAEENEYYSPSYFFPFHEQFCTLGGSIMEEYN